MGTADRVAGSERRFLEPGAAQRGSEAVSGSARRSLCVPLWEETSPRGWAIVPLAPRPHGQEGSSVLVAERVWEGSSEDSVFRGCALTVPTSAQICGPRLPGEGSHEDRKEWPVLPSDTQGQRRRDQLGVPSILLASPLCQEGTLLGRGWGRQPASVHPPRPSGPGPRKSGKVKCCGGGLGRGMVIGESGRASTRSAALCELGA